MTPDAAGIEAALAAGLAAHRLTWRTSTLAVCTCGQWSGYDIAQGILDAPLRAHDAHVTTALLPVVTHAQAAERERIAQAVEAMVLTFEADYGIQSSPVARIKALATIARADGGGAR